MPHIVLEFSIPDDVLIQEFEGESVLLNLATETYFGLDDVGTRIWQLLQKHQNTESLMAEFLAEYDVDESVLQSDLLVFMEKLAAQGLLEMQEMTQSAEKS